ncbi:hypothetical protein WJ973_25670 [Achromobacter xylosoxidans]
MASTIKQIPCHVGRCLESIEAGAFVVPNRTNMVRHAPSASFNPVHPATKVRNATEYVLAPPFVAS